MTDPYCPHCKRVTEMVIHHSEGDTVCVECSFVLDEHYIDETIELRTFANEPNLVSVDLPTNPLLKGGGIDTFISKPNDVRSDFLISSLERWQNMGPNPDRTLIMGFKTIASMADRLALVAPIKNRAYEIFKKVEDQKSSRGRNQDAILAACLYIACTQEKNPRTIREIWSAVDGVPMEEIEHAQEFIVKQLELGTGQSAEIGTVHAQDFMRRFCSKLGMTNQAVKAAQEAAQNSEKFDIRTEPESMAAAVIYIIAQLSDNKKLLKDVSRATGVAEGTIKNVYKYLYPHVIKITPSWYATEENLKNLSRPWRSMLQVGKKCAFLYS